MARIKKEEELVKPAEEAVVENNEKNEEGVVTNEQSVETEETPVQVEEKKHKEAEIEIPAFAEKLMRNFSNLEELYITSKGGVFTKDTPESLVGDAKLYKNPYYKK